MSESAVDLRMRSGRSLLARSPRMWLGFYRIHRKYAPPMRAAARALRVLANVYKGRGILRAKWHPTQ